MEQLSIHLRFIKCGYVSIIDGRHSLATLREISNLPGIYLTNKYILRVCIIRRDGKYFQSW